MEPKEEKPLDESLAGPGVLEKYTHAGKIAKQVLQELIPKLTVGADLHELTRWGSARINELCQPLFTSKKIEKGVAFPVCITPNELCGNFSPLKEESRKIAEGDLLKIELGVHFNGFPVSLAHSIIVGKASDDENRLLNAGYLAVENAVKAVAVGNKSSLVTKVLEQIPKAFKVSQVDGAAMREIKRFLLEGGRIAPAKTTPGEKVESFEFKTNEVYAVEALVSLNETEGKTKASEIRTTVFRRNIENSGDLKTQNGRTFLRDFRLKFSDMTGSLNAWDDELVARIGSNDALNHQLVTPLPVLFEKSKAKVAHFKWTVAVTPKRLFLLAAANDIGFKAGELPALEDPEVKKVCELKLEALTAKPPVEKKEKKEEGKAKEDK